MNPDPKPLTDFTEVMGTALFSGVRKPLSLLWLPALATLLLVPSGSRQVAAWPAQGTIERAGELSAPAHRAPEAPRLQSDLGQGQGGARHDRGPSPALPEAYPAVAARYSSLAVPVVAPRSSVGSALLGAPLFPTGPPSTVS